MTVPVLYVQGSAERAGAERMLFYLLQHLDRKSFSPTVLFLADGPFIDEVEALGIPVVRGAAAARLRQLGSWRRTIQEIESHANQTRARIIHANGERMSIFTGRAARRTGAASIAWLHDAPGAGGMSGRIAQWLLAKSPKDAVVTCSRWLADDFNALFGMGAVPIQNGLDLGSMSPRPTAGDAMRRIADQQGWPADAKVVGFFGRLQRWKGTDIFLRASKRIAQDNPDARFLVVGGTLYGRDADFMEELEALADSLDLRQKLFFTGYRPDALDLMAATDIVVHCSLQPDPFPTVILEAMALGKPVVATRTRGPEEAIEHGQTGLLVAPGDPDALAASVSGLLRSPVSMRDLGASARKHAEERFDARRMAAEFASLYRGFLSSQAVKSSDHDRLEAPR